MRQIIQKAAGFLLAIALLITALPALAAADVAFWQSVDGGSYLYNQSMAAIGDKLYLLCNDQIYLWQPGDDEPALFIESLAPAEADPFAETSYNGVSYLFAKDGCLYGLDISTSQVLRFTDEGGQPVRELVCTLATETEDTTERYIRDFCYANGKLYELWDGSTTQIAEYALEDGAQPVLKDAKGVNAIAPYRDGKLVAATVPAYGESEVTPPQLISYDPASGATEPIYQTTEVLYPSAIGYNEATGVIYYWLESDVYAYTEGGEPYICLCMPEMGEKLCLLNNGQLALGCYGGTYVRTPSATDASAQSLTIMGEYGSQPHLAVVAEHPELSISVSNNNLDDLQSMANEIVSGSGKLDVMMMGLSYRPVERLIAKGYAAELDQYPAVMAIAQQMDPRFLAPFQYNGKLYGLPVSLNAQALTVDKTVWVDELGLSLDDLPATYEEWLDFIANFTYDYGDDHEDVMLADSWDLRQEILNMVLQNEVAYQMREGKDNFDFNTPRFQKLMKLLDAIDFSDISISKVVGENATDDDFNEVYSKKMIFSLYYSVTDPRIFNPESNMIPVPLALEEGLDPVIPAQVSVLLINARTSLTEAAATYLASYASHLSADSENITLFPDHNAAVPNTRYEEELKDFQTALTKRETALETALPENKASLQDEIAMLKESMADYSTHNKELLSAEEIAAYREKIDPWLYPLRQTPVTSYGNNDSDRSVQTLLEQYAQNAIDGESFIRELNNRIRLIQLENQ